MDTREERHDTLIASASCSPQFLALRMPRNDNAVRAPSPGRWPVSKAEHGSRQQRRTAVLVLASVPAAHGMFASADSVALPFIFLSDTVRHLSHQSLRQIH